MQRVRQKQTKNQRREAQRTIQQAIALDDGPLSPVLTAYPVTPK